MVNSLFPEGHKVTVMEPMYLREGSPGVTMDVPQIKGWSVELDRSTEVGTQHKCYDHAITESYACSLVSNAFLLHYICIINEQCQA